MDNNNKNGDDFDLENYIKEHSDDADFSQSSFDDFFGSDDGLIKKPSEPDDIFKQLDIAFGGETSDKADSLSESKPVISTSDEIIETAIPAETEIAESTTDKIVTDSLASDDEAIRPDVILNNSETDAEVQKTAKPISITSSAEKTKPAKTTNDDSERSSEERIAALRAKAASEAPAVIEKIHPPIVSTLLKDDSEKDSKVKKSKKKTTKKDGVSVSDNSDDNNGGHLHPIFTPKGITSTLKENYMPYAMSVIISRAIPEIDGFKPSHRKLLYTMYKMGLLSGGLTKSANIVGSTMKLNPHGDAAIYDTMVRLARGHEALLHPFVESKGNFGKHYSRDMQCAASRYTEAKLAPICAELFRNIDKSNVVFNDNYDGTMKEPALLPVTFPTVLTTPNIGIAVGMASAVCSFNLAEVCAATVEYIRNTECDLSLTLKAPDFSTGAQIILSHDEMRKIYETGRGSFKMRSKYRVEPGSSRIEVYEIPYTTTVEVIIDRIIGLIKEGKIKEISEIRDETDKQGLRMAIELKRGNDPDRLMQKLYSMTPLEDSFGCNFNILVGGSPRVMGIKEILDEWLVFRVDCIKKELAFDLVKMRDKLHLLYGLRKIILDIDKAIKIVRETEDDALVVPNLIIGFGIDEIQAEYVADIKLRNLNKQYLLNRLDEVEALEKDIADTESTLASKTKIKNIIIRDLEAISKKYGIPRKSEIIFKDDIEVYDGGDEVEDYPVNLFFTASGYFKKITPLSLRMGSEQKLKEDDRIVLSCESMNSCDMLFFTDKCQVYKSRVSDFADCKASSLGHFVPSVLGFEPGENCVFSLVTKDYSGFVAVFFKNGKAAKIPVSAYSTKTNRKRLINAFSDKSEAVGFVYSNVETDVLLRASNERFLLVNTGMIALKTTKNTQGVQVMTLKSKNTLVSAAPLGENDLVNPHHYKVKNIPAAGCFLKDEDKKKDQLTL